MLHTEQALEPARRRKPAAHPKKKDKALPPAATEEHGAELHVSELQEVKESAVEQPEHLEMKEVREPRAMSVMEIRDELRELDEDRERLALLRNTDDAKRARGRAAEFSKIATKRDMGHLQTHIEDLARKELATANAGERSLDWVLARSQELEDELDRRTAEKLATEERAKEQARKEFDAALAPPAPLETAIPEERTFRGEDEAGAGDLASLGFDAVFIKGYQSAIDHRTEIAEKLSTAGFFKRFGLKRELREADAVLSEMNEEIGKKRIAAIRRAEEAQMTPAELEAKRTADTHTTRRVAERGRI